MKLSNQTILITGASSGIGSSVALELSKQNNNIIITARRENLLLALKEKIEANGSQCLVLPADSTDQDAVANLLNQSIESFGKIDIAFLNAGGSNDVAMSEITVESLKQTISVNLDTVTNYLPLLIQHMKINNSGTIAYTSSPAGFYGLPGAGAYCASKAAGKILFETCRLDMAATPIKFVSIFPGFCYTELFTEKLRRKNGIPKWLVINQDRATHEILSAIEKGKANHFFPKRLKVLHALGGIVPEAIRKAVLSG